MKYYVYELIDPRDKKVFYVGKGQHKRMYAHVQAVRVGRIPNKANHHLYHKIKQLLDEHYEPLYNKVFETDDESLAYDHEIKQIAFYGISNLCNLSTGGEGQHVALRGAKNSFYGRHHTPETIEIIRQANIGRHHSSISRQKISLASKGHILSEAAKQKISNKRKGIKFSNEHCKAISDSLKKRTPMTKETREKISKSLKGRVCSQETRDKIRASNIKSYHEFTGNHE
jgi:hypothetical protein